jgi:hypothetical protein
MANGSSPIPRILPRHETAGAVKRLIDAIVSEKTLCAWCCARLANVGGEGRAG